MLGRFALLLTPVLGAGCALLQPAEPPPSGPAVSGKVDYRELELLPRGAVLQIVLTSEEQGEPATLADWYQVDPGQAPFDFELDYEAESISEGAYTLSARITHGEHLLFRTTERFDVALWEEAERIRDEEETHRLALAELAPTEPGRETDSIEEALPPLDPRPLLDVGRIVLTKVPKTLANATLPSVAYLRGRAQGRDFEPFPEGASLVVTLTGSTPGEETETELARWESDFPGDVAVDYELAYDPAAVRAGTAYGLEAEVLLDGELLSRTTGRQPVDLDAALVRMRTTSMEVGPFPDEHTVASLELVRVPRAPSVQEAPPEAGSAVTGRVHTGRPDPVPAGAVLTVRLIESATSERAERVVAESVVEDPGGFPIPFRVPFDPAALDPQQAHFVFASLEHEGELLFRTTTRFDVDLAGAGSGGAIAMGAVQLRAVPRKLDPVPDPPVPDPTDPEEPDPTTGKVHGRIMYLSRKPLPSDAVLVMRLVATSLTARTERVLAELENPTPGQVPIDFTLEYDPGDLEPDTEFTLRAELTSGGQKLYLTTRKAVVELPVPPEDRPEAWTPPPTNAGNVLVTEVPR